MRLTKPEAEFSLKLDSFERSLKEAFFSVMRRTAREMDASLKNSLSQTGAVVGGKRMSSPAYGAPYKVSGNLLSATGVTYKENANGALIRAGTDISRAPYAPYLEYGTARMKPRPYLLSCGAAYFNRIRAAMRELKGEL